MNVATLKDSMMLIKTLTMIASMILKTMIFDDGDVDDDDDGRAAPLIPDLHWPIDTISLTRQPVHCKKSVLVSVSVQLIS